MGDLRGQRLSEILTPSNPHAVARVLGVTEKTHILEAIIPVGYSTNEKEKEPRGGPQDTLRHHLALEACPRGWPRI